MKKYIVFAFFVALAQPVAAQAPTITSFTPTTGRTGDTITITGTGFDLRTRSNAATFGGTSFESSRALSAFEVNSDGTEIKVVVPGTAQLEK